MQFSRQEYWSGLPCPPPGDLTHTGSEPVSPALQADSLQPEPPGKPKATKLQLKEFGKRSSYQSVCSLYALSSGGTSTVSLWLTQFSSVILFRSVQLLSRVRLFATPWTVAHQASLSITNCQGLLRLMSIELVMPSNHLILCRPLLLLPSIFPSIRVFSAESVLLIRWPNIGASASAAVLPMNIQD